MKTMTIPDLADTAGCSEKTIRRLIGDTMPGRMVNGKVTRLTQDEARVLMEKLPKRNLVKDLGQMSGLPRPNVQGQDVAALVRETVHAVITELVPVLMAAFRGHEPAARPALPAPAPLSIRAELRKVVQAGVHAPSEFKARWDSLYSEYYYRCANNIRLRAKHRDVPVLEYAEDEGLLPSLLSLAYELFAEVEA
jgi:hypothetical protein